MVKKQYWILALPFLVVLIDQLAKQMVLRNIEFGKDITLIPNLLYLTNISNTGTVFGLFKGLNLLFVLVTVFALALIAFWFYKTKETQLKVILALVSGAATGNLVDRLAYGSVVDFIKLSFYPPVFNIADSVLTICIVWLAVYFTVKENKPKRKK